MSISYSEQTKHYLTNSPLSEELQDLSPTLMPQARTVTPRFVPLMIMFSTLTISDAMRYIVTAELKKPMNANTWKNSIITMDFKATSPAIQTLKILGIKCNSTRITIL
jgi:hypothetical protein